MPRRFGICRCVAASCALVIALAAGSASAQEMGDLPAMEDAFEAGAPVMESGGGEFFSQELGTLLRLRYNTESYGQDRRGNFDIGTMQIQNFEDAIAFFDGQVTLNDVNGVGYNLGVGFRWLHWSPFPIEPERITGFSFWTDGTSTESGNFFPQIGLSFESLGDRWDLRVNGYIPVGQKSQLGSFTPTGNISYDQNFLVEEAVADRNTSFYVAEAEVAARLLSDRDAWAFAGPYTLVNDEEDTLGYRAGFRGYAYPDLLAQIAVSNDDIFKTNAAFQVTWFVGRTRNNFQPACGLPDRMREPVMRNDYVALRRTQEVGGTPLTGTDGEPIRIVHVYSDAPSGGDGTFEHPLNNVGNVQANSIENDIVLLWSQSVFQNQNTLVLQDNQRLLGEGNGEFFVVATQEQGNVVLPETRPGSRDFARSIIQGTTGPGAVRLADTNEVANFNIDGTGSAAGAEGIFSPGTGAGNPNIHDLDFSNVSGTGIQFTPLTRPDEDNPALSTVAGNVTIADVNFDNMAGVEIDINSATTTDVTDPNVTLQETIAISNVDSQNGGNIGVWLRNTHNNRTATITNYTNGTAGAAGSGGGDLSSGVLVFEGTMANDFDGDVTLTNIDIFNNTGYALHFNNVSTDSATTITNNNGLTWNGGADMAGGMRFNNFNGTFTGNSSQLSNGTLSGLAVMGATAGTITLNSTVTFDSIDPAAGADAVINIGPNGGDAITGDIIVNGNITNHDTGRLVSIQKLTNASASVTLNGDMTDVDNANSTGIFVGNNTAGTVLFSGDLDIDTTNSRGIQLATNGTTDISFSGLVAITTDGANSTGFEATGGGMLTVSGTTNTVTTNGSAGVDIEGMNINTTGVNFSEVNVTGSATNGIRLVNNTNGPIVLGTLGDDPGDSGSITNTANEAIYIENSANVTVSSISIDSPGQTGVSVRKTTTGTQTVNLNDLVIGNTTTAGSTRGIDIQGDNGATDTLNMTINDVAINNATEFGIRVNMVDAGTINVNGTTIDGDTASGTAQGVQIADSNATVTFDADTSIAEFGGTDFEVNAGTGNVTYNGDITNTAGRSVHIHNRTGGAVQFSSTSSIVDSGQGILVEDNGTGSISFLGTNDLDTTTNDAVRLEDNDFGGTNATITFASLSIETTGTGRGFVATGGGTVSVTGNNNTIKTVNGTGLQLVDMNISNIDFASVNVSGAGGGPLNAILLQNLTGGQVDIGTTTGADGAGGSLTSTGTAIIISNAANVALHDINVVNASGATADAVAITKSSTAASVVNLDNVDATNAGRHGVNIDASSSGTLNVTMTDTDMTTVGQNGIAVAQSGTGAVTITATDTDFATVGQDGVNMNVTGSGAVNFTATNTTLTTVAGQAVELDANTSANVVNVTLNNLTTSDAIDIDAQDNANVDFRISGSTITGANVTAATIDSAALDYRFTNSTISGTTTMNINGSGDFDMLVENSSITTSGAANGIVLAFGANSEDADVIIRNNSTFNAANGQALVVTANGTNATIDFLLSGNSMSDSGALATADIRVSGGAAFNANIVNNTITNSGGDELFMLSDGTSTRIDLDLDNNNAGAAGVYHLQTTNTGAGFNFGVVD
ncbi:MAG: beta strand repeat-containing protein, partial [Pirellulales bacterium]